MMEPTEGVRSPLRLSILADQLGSPVGGGRFIRGFLAAMFSESDILDLLRPREDIWSDGILKEILQYAEENYPNSS